MPASAELFASFGHQRDRRYSAHESGTRATVRAALEHMREVCSAYSNLEFDIASGERGKRDVHVDRLFRQTSRRDA